MDPITDHQPPIEDSDLVADESLDSSSDTYPVANDPTESIYCASARRYLAYRRQYFSLFNRFLSDAYEFFLSRVDGKCLDVEEARYELVEHWLWAIMDSDLELSKD